MNKSQLPLYCAEAIKSSRLRRRRTKMKTTKEEKSRKEEIVYFAHV
jgi:hypothetical protein